MSKLAAPVSVKVRFPFDLPLTAITLKPEGGLMSYFDVSVAQAQESERSAYLQKVLSWTVGGLFISGLSSVVSATVLAGIPTLLHGYAPMILIMGCWAITNFVARPMVFGESKVLGFVLGTAAQGVAMGFLLLAAMLVGGMVHGSPFLLVGLAAGLTGFSALGMATYTYVMPRDFSMIGAGLSAMSIPMLILMAVSFAFPSVLGGVFGLIMGGVFVVISVGSLLYQLNQVMHQFNTRMHIEGAYTVSLGILVLFWTILSLLMRLNRR
jgi:FtsH-binding integral membrane protein